MDGQFRVQATSDSVYGWSSKRLPFEPKGWLLDYRSALRAALRSIPPVNGLGLAASYQAPDEAFVDVENVLCYNIGSGAYAHLIGGGLQLTRSRSEDGLHHVTYRLAQISVPNTSAVAATVSVAVPSGTRSAGQWWSLLRPNMHVSQMFEGRPFGVAVAVRGGWTNAGLASSMKPMLDGLVSALHAHDRTQREQLVPRLAALGDPVSIWQMLCDPSQAALGTRRLLRAHGPNGFAWNPADDQCTGVSIVRSRRQARQGIDAEVYTT